MIGRRKGFLRVRVTRWWLFLHEILLAHPTHIVHSSYLGSWVLTKACSSRWDILSRAHTYHASLRVLLWHLHLLLACTSFFIQRRYDQLLRCLIRKFQVRISSLLEKQVHGYEEHRLWKFWIIFWIWELPYFGTYLLVHLCHHHHLLHLLGWECPWLIRIEFHEHLHIVCLVFWTEEPLRLLLLLWKLVSWQLAAEGKWAWHWLSVHRCSSWLWGCHQLWHLGLRLGEIKIVQIRKIFCWVMSLHWLRLCHRLSNLALSTIKVRKRCFDILSDGLSICSHTILHVCYDSQRNVELILGKEFIGGMRCNCPHFFQFVHW